MLTSTARSRRRSSGRLILAMLIGLLSIRPMTSARAEKPTTQAVVRSSSVLNGIDVLQRDDFAVLNKKRVGLITNHTGINQHGVSTVHLLHEAPQVDLQILFSPEHGFAGKLDTRIIGDTRDTQTGLTVISLYGETRTPPDESLEGIDTIVFDIQDIGARFYTYVSTMKNAMRAAAAHDLEFIVLDRPNPINGVDVAGPVLDPGLESFVGYHPVAVRHGMTVGEIATMLNDELEMNLQLTVIPIENWQRDSYFDGTGLLWVNPSPNMRNLNEAILYPGIGLLETTNVSVGRGTDTPFEVLGAPWITARELAVALNRRALPGVTFVPIRFTPQTSKFAQEECEGVSILITDRSAIEPVRTGLIIAIELRRLYPDAWETASFNRLLSNQQTFDAVLAGHSIDAIETDYSDRLQEFRDRRRKYLLY